MIPDRSDNGTRERSTHCGRLDDHEPHEWLGRDRYPATPTVVRDCPGAPLVEGGNPIRRSTPEEIAGDDAYEARYGRDY